MIALPRSVQRGGLFGLALSLTLAASCGERAGSVGAGVEDATESARIEGLFLSSCITCHAAGVANAPRLGDPRWGELVAQKGMAALVANVRQGYNAMPPMGACPDCADEDLRLLIVYMMESQR